MSNQTRIDGAGGEALRDTTFRNSGEFTSAGEEVDRQTKFLQNSMEGGIGDDQYGRMGSDARHMVTEVDETGRKGANEVVETQQQQLGAIRRSAQSI